VSDKEARLGALLANSNPASLTKRLRAIPTTLGSPTRLAYARAQAAGIEVGSLLKKAGLTKQQIEDVRTRIGVPCQIRFLNLAARALQDTFLGFHIGQLAELREWGLAYYVPASSQTLGEALRRGARFLSMVNEGISVKYLEEKDINIVINYVDVSRHLDRHQIECVFTLLIRLIRKLTDSPVRPGRVTLIHHRAGDFSEFAEFLGSDIEFGATIDELTFAAPTADLPVVSADQYLNEVLIEMCEQAVSRRKKKRSLLRCAVENAIAPVLPHGTPQVSEIAHRCGVSQRTLVRRLMSESLTYSEILNDLRKDLATEYLADPGLSISQIAWLLGYRDVSAFTNAFRRWTGESPRETRFRLLRA
jgi:AraC-like DNA-binding protein